MRGMRRHGVIVLALALAVSIGTLQAGAAGDDPAGSVGEERFSVPAATAALGSSSAGGAGGAGGSASNMELVGHFDPGVESLSADVWVHDGFAYLGSPNRGCTGHGARILDVSDPTNPVHTSTVAETAGSSAEDIVVRKVRTPFFRGDLLAVGIQDCVGTREAENSGFNLYDVSDPTNPVWLSFFGTSVEGFVGGPAGVHELDMIERGNRVYALLAVPNSETRHPEQQGDFRIVEITDPQHPVQLAHWGVGAQLGLDPATGQGCSRTRFNHSVSSNRAGTLAYLSYWDAGMITLDIRDPANPVFLGRTVYPSDADGDTHSVHVTRGGTLALVQDEDFCFNVPNEGQPRSWGFLRFFDISDPRNPIQVATYATPNTTSLDAPPGRFTVHNSVVRGQTAYVSWYSDGIRALRIRDLGNIREIGHFVPPPGEGRGGLPTSAQVWGVVVENSRDHGRLVYFSDILSGLWIVRLTPGS